MYIYPYDKRWNFRYQAETSNLLQSSEVSIEFIHIGSTSINGLAAKNCIDILGIVDDIDDVHLVVESYETLGYEYRGEYGIVGRHYFSKRGEPKVHLHVCAAGHEQIARHLHFKNVMCSRPDLVSELNSLKLALQSSCSKREYQEQKISFYEKIHELKHP
jgi:GrpB-like predicted nucleotidyltransferase (UPF0157 family)